MVLRNHHSSPSTKINNIGRLLVFGGNRPELHRLIHRAPSLTRTCRMQVLVSWYCGYAVHAAAAIISFTSSAESKRICTFSWYLMPVSSRVLANLSGSDGIFAQYDSPTGAPRLYRSHQLVLLRRESGSHTFFRGET